jgi:threonine/homoserine/homoserine lactone efflux protein
VSEIAAFLGVALLVIVTPGQDTALTIRNTLLGGRRSGVFTALGVATGQAFWSLAASAGITAVLIASEPAFAVVKFAGAAYLVILGAQSLWSAVRGRGTREAPAEGPERRLVPRAAFRQGLISNLGNPKMAVFFTSLLPQFAPETGPSFLVLMALGLVFCSLTFAWLTGYSIAVDRAGDFLRRPRVRRVLDGVMGTALVALGVRLAAQQRA